MNKQRTELPWKLYTLNLMIKNHIHIFKGLSLPDNIVKEQSKVHGKLCQNKCLWMDRKNMEIATALNNQTYSEIICFNSITKFLFFYKDVFLNVKLYQRLSLSPSSSQMSHLRCVFKTVVESETRILNSFFYPNQINRRGWTSAGVRKMNKRGQQTLHSSVKDSSASLLEDLDKNLPEIRKNSNKLYLFLIPWSKTECLVPVPFFGVLLDASASLKSRMLEKLRLNFLVL